MAFGPQHGDGVLRLRLDPSRRLFAVVLAALAVACSGCSPNPARPTGFTEITGPPAAALQPFIGTWTGTVTHTRAGRGAAELVVLTARDGSLAGTWSFTFSDPEQTRRGQLLVDTPMLPIMFGTLTIEPPESCPSFPGLPRAHNAALIAVGNRMTGDVSYRECAANATGSIELTKR